MNTQHCSICGAPLAADAPRGHCPVCLLSLPHEDSAPRQELGTATLGGTRVIGDYQLLGQLGRGGMGVVYRARQVSLNRSVAVKMLLNSALSSPAMVRRFEMEAETVARLDHPHIVPIYEVREENGQRYFSMKLVEGESLSQQIGHNEFQPHPADPLQKERTWAQIQDRIARLMVTIARAVHYAHSKGVLHRDLKPANILIDSDGLPHLTDFGLAKCFEDVTVPGGDVSGPPPPVDEDPKHRLTGSGEILGTPAYMAPEQTSGKAATALTDVYSLGAILYELLTGRKPFNGATPLETFRQIEHSEPARPESVNPRVAHDLSVICLKCLEKEPIRRYSNALVLAEDLERWLRNEPIQARVAGPLLRLRRWTRRNPIGATLILTLCLGLGGAGALLRVVYEGKEKERALREKESSARGELEVANKQGGHLLKLTVEMLRGNLNGLWASTSERYLVITSDQLAALAARPIIDVTNKASMIHYKVGLAAHESPVDESRRYAFLFAYLEKEMSKRLGAEVRLDLKLYKYPHERMSALAKGELDFVRNGAFPALKAIDNQLPIHTLVEQSNPGRLAVFFTRTNTGIKSLADIKGKAMAFGETNATISFVAQMKLTVAGVSAKDFTKYGFLDSRTEFMEDVMERGFDAAVKRVGELSSHAEVIERVVDGTYDVGICNQRMFEKNQRRGLVIVPGTVFENLRNFWVGRADLPPEAEQTFIDAMTTLKDDEGWLPLLPGTPNGFRAITDENYGPERKAMRLMEVLFPWRGPPATNEPARKK